MSSILSGFDSSNIAEDSHLLEFENNYELGDVVPEEEAEKVIDRKNKTLRKGEFILVREPSAKGYVYAIFEGHVVDTVLSYDAGDGSLSEAEAENVYKIKDYRSFGHEMKKSFKNASKRTPARVKWSKHKDIRIISGNHRKQFFHDATMQTNRSTYAYLLKHHAFSKDPVKFLNIAIVDEIVKNHVFNDYLALKALKIRVLHDDQLLQEFDRAADALEKIRHKYDRESNQKAKDLTLDQYQTAATVLKLFMHEVSRRGLEGKKG